MRPTFGNENGGTFILIEPGETGDIIVKEPFFIGARPVTQVEWSVVMGDNPSKFQDGWSAGLRPVERVSWLDTQEFISRLNERESEPRLGLSGVWRLPTAEEWEFACRAGTTSRWYHSDRDADLDEVAWHGGNSGATTREVGQKKSNDWGLFDCHGNVAEWTSTEVGIKRITKGGSWLMESESTTSSYRGISSVDKRSDGIGLRLVWSPI
ncbi:MAG: SUMF1/EgtB/PvdO family nonheme iron enzyme [Euryarchaeota archaeon]|nr:formylglycine-generating enzyme family protein [Euryarchaeota archaeon]MBT7245163.1 formylglycine-generating enzyme family protein [Euryarchaeota archaeon]NCF97210.1 SUMF1/EgtB/PvdO family nonheme iron enzyme [Euryarchaeota archaeon]